MSGGRSGCFMSSDIPGNRHQGFPENATGNSRLSPSGFLPWNDHMDGGGASFLSPPSRARRAAFSRT